MTVTLKTKAVNTIASSEFQNEARWDEIGADNPEKESGKTGSRPDIRVRLAQRYADLLPD